MRITDNRPYRSQILPNSQNQYQLVDYFLPRNPADTAPKKRVTETREEPPLRPPGAYTRIKKRGMKLFWDMNRNILSLPRHDLSIPLPHGSAYLCHRGYHQFIGRTWKSQTMPPSSPRRSWVCSDHTGEKRALRLRRWWFREEKSVEALWEWQLLLWSKQTWKWPQPAAHCVCWSASIVYIVTSVMEK